MGTGLKQIKKIVKRLLFHAVRKSRRRYKRIRRSTIIRLISLKTQSCEKTAQTIDISEGGVQVETNFPLKQNEVLHLEMWLTELDKEINFLGKVVWNRGSGRNNYRSGIEFQAMAEEDRELLGKYLLTSA